MKSIRPKEFFSKLLKVGCAILFSLLMIGWGTQGTKTEPNPPLGTTSRAILDEKALLIENINQVLETDSPNAERLTKIEYGVPEKGDITITWSIEDIGDQKSTKVDAQNDAVNILKVLEQNKTRFVYVILSGTFSIQDEHGNTIEIEAMRLDFNKSTLDNIHWDDHQPTEIYGLADLSNLHPFFQ